MKEFTFMLIAGEPSGDLLGSELVGAIKKLPEVQSMPWPPRFIGAGGAHMAAAGVQLEIDLTQHAVFGISEVLAQYLKFRNIFHRLLKFAIEHQPDEIILIDYGGFNVRFAKAIQRYVRSHFGVFKRWNPKIVYYVSPQVWASREGRAFDIASNVDLLLSIFPFEKAWYAARVPNLRVEFVGNPMIDRHVSPSESASKCEHENAGVEQGSGLLSKGDSGRVGKSEERLIVLLPGSRRRELEAHLPILMEAAERLRAELPVRLRMILPNLELVGFAKRLVAPMVELEIEAKHLAESLAEADLAIACSGTVTLECALFRVPTVVMYKTSWLTYQLAKQIVTVDYIAMPNLLAGEAIYPELIQGFATPENVADAALDLLNNPGCVAVLKTKLAKVIESLGQPGASQRAADAVVRLLNTRD